MPQGAAAMTWFPFGCNSITVKRQREKQRPVGWPLTYGQPWSRMKTAAEATEDGIIWDRLLVGLVVMSSRLHPPRPGPGPGLERIGIRPRLFIAGKNRNKPRAECFSILFCCQIKRQHLVYLLLSFYYNVVWVSTGRDKKVSLVGLLEPVKMSHSLRSNRVKSGSGPVFRTAAFVFGLIGKNVSHSQTTFTARKKAQQLFFPTLSQSCLLVTIGGWVL